MKKKQGLSANNKPLVSVVMPVLNGGKYIGQAIKSILEQTFKDFELIIVNDGSTDNTLKVIDQFNDKRIRIVNNEKNLGLVKAINKGIYLAKGKYIARCDADDINKRDRFKKQVNYLENNSSYVLVGSTVEMIDESGKNIKESQVRKGYNLLPITDLQIRKEVFIRNPISHPSIMMRKKALEKVKLYRNFFNGGAEEYDLLFRLLRIGKAANLSENLIARRFHKDVFTKKHHRRVEFLALIARFINLPIINKFGWDISVGIFSFSLYKFWLNYLLFQNRLVPPEPDDSYFYLNAAKELFTISSFEQYRMMLFTIWLNFLKLITQFNFESVFTLNFYIGIVFMFACLIYFLRSFEKNSFNRAILITMLGVYTGSGTYHGFYWVLPSFYMLGFLFILLGIAFSTSFKFNIWLLLLVFLFVFFHPSSILFSVILLISAVLFFIIQRFKFSYQVNNLLKVFGLTLVFYILYSMIGKFFPDLGSLNSPADTFSLVLNLIKGQINLVSMPIIWHEYFRFIFLNWAAAGAFALCLIFGIMLKKWEIVVLYLSSLVLTILASVNPFGYRVLGLVWPLTFLILGYGIIGFKEFFKPIFPKFGLVFSIILLVIFVLFVSALNLIWIRSVNVKDNYSWDKSCPGFLMDLNKKVIFESWDGFYGFALYGLSQKNMQILNPNQELDESYLFVGKDRSQLRIYEPAGLEKLLTSNITRSDSRPQYTVPNYYWTNLGNNQINNFIKTEIKNCGFFKVYQLDKTASVENY